MSANKFSILKDRHLGERCVLVCNGPSLARMDTSFLKHETCIGLNKIYLGIQQFDFYPRYYVCVNDKVFAQSKPEIMGLNCVKFISRRAIKGEIVEDPLTYVIDTENPTRRFTRNLVEGVHEGWTVTYAALQVAHFLGFETVIIIGMDHAYEYDGQPNELTVMRGNDPNHFSNEYFASGQSWDLPDLARSEESYRIAKREFQVDNRRIIDATLDGKCDVFPKRNYRELFYPVGF